MNVNPITDRQTEREIFETPIIVLHLDVSIYINNWNELKVEREERDLG